MNFIVSYPNGITSHDPASMRVPPVMPNDLLTVKMALQTCMENDPSVGYRLVWMKNTLHVESFWISESLMDEAAKDPRLTITGEPREVPFDEDGNVPWLSKPEGPYGKHA